MSLPPLGGLACARMGRAAATAAVTMILAACGYVGSDQGKIDPKYGVAASPQLADKSGPIPRGGGVYKVGRPYQIAGNWYYPREDANYDSIGMASWYGDDFHGRQTANGEVFDMNALSAAHPTLPMPTYARVTNLENGRSVVVRINDRGPFAKGREIDLSREAARTLGMKRQGTAKVRVQYVSRARLEGSDDNWLRTTFVDGGATGDEPLTQLALAAENQNAPTFNRIAAAPAMGQTTLAATAMPQQQAAFGQPSIPQGQSLPPVYGLTPPVSAQAPVVSPVASQVSPAYTASSGTPAVLVPPVAVSGFADTFFEPEDRISAAFESIDRKARQRPASLSILEAVGIDPAGTSASR